MRRAVTLKAKVLLKRQINSAVPLSKVKFGAKPYGTIVSRCLGLDPNDAIVLKSDA